MSQIILFSRPIRSGKTTELMNWVKTQDSIGGFLTPDVADKRCLYLIQNKSFHPFETDSQEVDFISIGKFHFLQSAFETGTSQILKDAKTCKYLVLDEIGKLEMIRQTGWESALRNLFKIKDQHTFKLIVVVRDFLLQEFITHYKLDNPLIVHSLKDLNNE